MCVYAFCFQKKFRGLRCVALRVLPAEGDGSGTYGDVTFRGWPGLSVDSFDVDLVASRHIAASGTVAGQELVFSSLSPTFLLVYSVSGRNLVISFWISGNRTPRRPMIPHNCRIHTRRNSAWSVKCKNLYPLALLYKIPPNSRESGMVLRGLTDARYCTC